MARTTPQESPAAVALVPSVSSFDFLEGAFAAAQRTRKVVLGSALAAVAVLTVLALLGVGALLAKQSQTQLLAATRSQNDLALAKLATIDNAGGFSADRLSAHVGERLRGQKAAVGKEIDVVGFIRAIQATAPAGVQVTSITFHDSGAAAVNTAPVAGAPAAPTPAASAPAAGVAHSDQVGTVEIKGTVSSFALIGAWGRAVGTIPGLTGENPTWAGGGTAIATTLTATITQSGMTKRAQDLLTTTGKGTH